MSEPALIIELSRFRFEAFKAVAVGADGVDGDNLVGVRPIEAVGAVAARAGGSKDGLTFFG